MSYYLDPSIYTFNSCNHASLTAPSPPTTHCHPQLIPNSYFSFTGSDFPSFNRETSTNNKSIKKSPKKKEKVKSSLPDPIENEESANDKEIECVVCLDRGVKTVLYPCNHSILCVSCSLILGVNNKESKCPKCRNPIKKIKRIYN